MKNKLAWKETGSDRWEITIEGATLAVVAKPYPTEECYKVEQDGYFPYFCYSVTEVQDTVWNNDH
jgi:hypothetical protein